MWLLLCRLQLLCAIHILLHHHHITLLLFFSVAHKKILFINSLSFSRERTIVARFHTLRSSTHKRSSNEGNISLSLVFPFFSEEEEEEEEELIETACANDGGGKRKKRERASERGRKGDYTTNQDHECCARILQALLARSLASI